MVVDEFLGLLVGWMIKMGLKRLGTYHKWPEQGPDVHLLTLES